jgi:alpha-methylacyl-CoA racemase
MDEASRLDLHWIGMVHVSGGPLDGIRLVEISGIGPGPMAAMLLADMGADVIRVDRAISSPSGGANRRSDALGRSRRSVAIDLRQPEGVELVLKLVERADGLMAPFRPGVAERLGIGPHECLERNQKIVYGRMTGWGQEGPLSKRAGHDINYIAITGALDAIGRAGAPPTPPLNLVADGGGGAMLLAFGMVCGLIEAIGSGGGQVIDAALVDGVSLLFAPFLDRIQSGDWGPDRGTNIVDSGAPFYDVYETSDHKYLSIGAIESQFYTTLVKLLGWDPAELPEQLDRSSWPHMKVRFAETILERTRDEWCAVLVELDTCVAQVLTATEAIDYSHATARSSYVAVDGISQPAPAPSVGRETPFQPRRPYQGATRTRYSRNSDSPTMRSRRSEANRSSCDVGFVP